MLNLITELIQTVYNNPAGASAVAAILSSAVAFVAVFGGILATIINNNNAKRQIKATLVSAHRQRRLDEFRDSIAQALRLMMMLQLPANSLNPALRIEKADEFVLHHARIQLLIDSSEQDDMKLLEVFQDVYGAVRSVRENPTTETNKTLDDSTKLIILIARRILEREMQTIAEFS